MKKLNCWEVKKCGQDTARPGSRICPVRDETRLDGVHGGVRAGRACWVVTGTFCDGRDMGDFSKKYDVCEKCDFYRQVRSEEGMDYQFSIMLLKRLRGAGEVKSRDAAL